MLIPINDQFRIKSDSMQWMIQRRRTRNGKPSWESKLFFPTLQGAINELGELMVRLSDADTLALDCIRGRGKRCYHALPSLDAPIRGGFRDHPERTKTKNRIDEGLNP